MEPMETLVVTLVGQDKQDKQLPCAEPRVAVAAAPHKRRAVAAVAAVETGGDGGKPPAGPEEAAQVAAPTGGWQVVMRGRGRAAQRQAAA
eukprot:4820646-Prymnesium_polylepis.1